MNSTSATTLDITMEARKSANRQRMLTYYGLIPTTSFANSLRSKKLENEKRRIDYYGLQYFQWMNRCKIQNETMKRSYYGLDETTDSTQEEFDFEALCAELEQFMKTNWAAEMEKESVRQWKLDQVRINNNN